MEVPFIVFRHNDMERSRTEYHVLCITCIGMGKEKAYMRSVIFMQKAIPRSRGSIVYVSREIMESIINGPKEKYDAKKASREAKKNLRKQGLKI